MAPPGQFTVKQLNALRAKALFKQEEKRKEFVFENIPELLRNELVDFLVESGEVEIEWEEMLNFLEERVLTWDKKTSIVVKIDRVMNVKFTGGSQANMDLLKDLQVALEPLNLNKSEEKTILKFLYIHKTPRAVKEKLDDICVLPDFDDLYEIARKADLRFGQREHFGRRYSEREEKSDGGVVRERKWSFERSKNSKDSIKIGDGARISFKKKEDRKKEDSQPVLKTFFTSNDKNNIIKTTIIIENREDNPIEVGVDTCAEASMLTMKDFNRLPEEIKKRLVADEWFLTRSWHGSHNKVKGYIDTSINIKSIEESDVSVRFFVAEGEMSLLGIDLIRKLGINPLQFENHKSYKNYVDEFGIEYGEKLPLVEQFLKSDKAKVLTIEDYEPGNVIEAEFKVSEDFTPRRGGIIPIPKEYKNVVEDIFKKEVSYGWWEKVSASVDNSIPLIVVPKAESSSVRLVFSCKNINKFVKVPEMSILPSHKDILRSGVDTISVIDINNAFRRVNLAEVCRNWLIVGTPFGYFRPTNLIFGFSLSPILFYQSILKVLENFKEFIHIYMDDILVSSSRQDHERVLLGILMALSDVNFKLSTRKCKFMVSEAQFIGYQISTENRSISIPRERLNYFLNIKTPDSGKELKKVLASINYYASSIPGYALAVQPLFKFEKEKGNISEKIKILFRNLLECVAKAIALCPIKENVVKLKLEVATNEKALSTFISCVYEEGTEPMYSYGRLLRKSELNYNYATKLLLGVKEALYAILPISCGYPIEVHCDVKKLILEEVIPRVAMNTYQRLLVDILPFNIQVKSNKLIKDKSMAALIADSMKNPEKEGFQVFKMDFCEGLKELPFEIGRLIEKTREDSNGMTLLKGNFSEEDKANLHSCLRQQLKAVEVVEGVVLIAGRLFIPESLEKEVICFLHKFHQSYSNMVKECRKKFYFINYVKKLSRLVHGCEICNILQRNKKLSVVSWPEAKCPRERYHLDVGQVSAGKFLCCSDVFSGFITTRHISREDSKSCVNALGDIFQCIGLPLITVSDNARMFTAIETACFFEQLGVKHCFSVANKSQSNGHAERAIGIIKSALVKFLKEGKSFRNSLNLATLKAQKRYFKDTNRSCADIFFDLKLDMAECVKKYNYRFEKLNEEVWFKKDRAEKEWSLGLVCERLSDTLYKIMKDGKAFVRSSDSIRFVEAVMEKENSKEEKGSGTIGSLSDQLDISFHEFKNDDLCFSETLEARDFKCFNGLKEEREFPLEKKEEDSVQVMAASDGSALGGKGMAYIISAKEKIWKEGFRIYNKATAQDTEVFGFLLCLQKLKSLINDGCLDMKWKMTVLTDSAYVSKGVNEYLQIWSTNGWKRVSGIPLIHAPFWKIIWKILKELPNIEVKWVKGHSDCKWNIMVDGLAKTSAQSRDPPLSKEDVWALCGVNQSHLPMSSF